MKFKVMSKIAAMIITLGFAVNVNAQTATDAVDALKDGVAKSKSSDYLGAVESFKKCVKIYDELGETENENRATAVKQIPNMQYKHAISLYKQNKYDESIAAFETLKEYSKTYEDPKLEKKAKSTIPKLYYAKGKDLYDSKEYDAALEALNKSLELNPKYSMSYVRKAQVYQELNDSENFKKAIDGALANAKAGSKTENTAKQLGGNFFLKAGAEAFKKENYANAVKYFNTVLEYKEADSNIYHQLAAIYNKQSKWDSAIEAANKSLKLFKDAGTTKDAKIYYELGNAYAGKGDNAAACDAYKKANKGDYAEASKYQIEHVLKCQ